MAVHFSKIFIGVAINLIDWIFFDKFKILFENVVQFIKVRPNFLFIFEHQLNNLRQFLVLGFVENVWRKPVRRFVDPHLRALSCN